MSITQETRRESYRATNTATRKRILLWAFERYGPMTARECAAALGYQDLNAVKPRITELCGEGLLEAAGKRKDPVTDRNVAVFKLKEDRP